MEHKVLSIKWNALLRGQHLGPLAYAAAAMTSNNRSRTMGDVLEDVNNSSNVSRNLGDLDAEIKTSDDFRSMIAQTWKVIKICNIKERQRVINLCSR